MLPKFGYARPGTVKEAVARLGSGARVHAGGTDLIGCLRDEVFGAREVVSLSGIDGLSAIAETADGGLRIGAMTPLADVAAHPAIQSRFTVLAEASLAVASPQLRNQGTIAGNLCQKPRCWYFRGGFECLRRDGEMCSAYDGDNRYHCIFGGSGCHYVHPSDTAPALAALGAVARVVGAGGARSVAVEKLFVLPEDDLSRETVLDDDELITEILIPAPPSGVRSTYRKVRTRGAWDFALVGMALAIVQTGGKVTWARVVFSGVAPVPWRAAAVEDAIAGKLLDEETIANAAAAAVAGAEPLEHNAYKVELLQGVVTEELSLMRGE